MSTVYCDDFENWFEPRFHVGLLHKFEAPHWVQYDTVFADPPDNIGLKYEGFGDKKTPKDYYDWCHSVLSNLCELSQSVWWSFNSKHTVAMGVICNEITRKKGYEVIPHVQTFTFGQNNNRRMGNGHRPLWLIRNPEAPLFPDAIRVPSWRQLNGDKRADPNGRVPLDVFDFPRVTGNSAQRRKWHPTQLHESLVERCLKYTCPPGGKVFDPFLGTGTTMRVAKRLGYDCDGTEISMKYAEKVAHENQACLIMPQPCASAAPSSAS